MRAWAFVVLFVAGSSGAINPPGAATAAPVSNVTPAAAGADALIARGVAARRQGKDEEALQIFRSAYALSPSPRGLAQIGLAEQALGRWLGAEEDLMGALNGANDPWISQNGSTLNKALGTVREHIGQLAVFGSPAGAAVRINGGIVGKLPLAEPIHVAAGDIVLALEAPGYESISRKVSVAAKSSARETIELPTLALPSKSPTTVAGAAGPKAMPPARPGVTALSVPGPTMPSPLACQAIAPAIFRFENSIEGFLIKSDEFTAFKTLAVARDRSWCSAGALQVNASYDLNGVRNKRGRFPNQCGQLIVPLGKHVDLTGKTLTARIYVDAPTTASFGAVVFAVNKNIWVGGKFIYPMTPGKWWSVAATYAAENKLYEGGTSPVDDVDAIAIQVDALGASSVRTWSGKIYVDDVDWR